MPGRPGRSPVFEHLDDPDPLVPGPAQRSAADHRAGRLSAARRTRNQRIAGAGLALVAIVSVGSVVGLRLGSNPGPRAALPSPSLPHHGSPMIAPGGSSPSSSSSGSLQATANSDRPGFSAQSTAEPFGATDSKDGACTGTEKAPPCAAGVVVGRYYAATIPSGCDHPIVFDGRRWWSDRTTIPGGSGTVVQVRLRLVPVTGGQVVEVVAPFGTATLDPVAHGSAAAAKGCPSRRP
jgi:hypothetical protein